MTKKLTADHYHKLAKHHKMTWLGEEASSTKAKTRWRCQSNHIWETSFDSIRRGYGCHICSKARGNEAKRRTIDDYKLVGSKAGIVWSGTERPFDVRTKTDWTCKDGHSWRACYYSIRAGTGCPKCGHISAAEKQRITAKEYRAIGREKGFHWLGTEAPKKAIHKTEWKCKQKHIFRAAWYTIRADVGCPKCAGNFRLSAADYERLGHEKGFLWAGKETPKNSTAKTNWLCIYSHLFDATQSDIKQNRGCPQCARIAQGDSRRLIAQDYHDFAKSKNYRWIGTQVPKSSRMPTSWMCEQGHSWKTNKHKIAEGSGCPTCVRKVIALSKRMQIKDYRAIEEVRGFRWLGPNLPINGREKTSWKCKENHTWLASASNVKKGTGCPDCAIDRQRLKLEDYLTVGQKYGFEWIDNRVPQKNSIKTTWRCLKGHIWKARYGNILSGFGCPFCVDILNGKRVSKNQRKLREILRRGKLNKRVLNFSVDLAISISGVKIAVEYDSWYFHGSEEAQRRDSARRKILRRLGWKTLQIRSDKLLPTKEILMAAIQRLVEGKRWARITLPDWGTGATFTSYHKA